MSRPYININSMSYTSQVLTMNYTYYKLRSATPTARTLTITGFSGSIAYTATHDSVDYSSGRTTETVTFSVPTLGTSSTTTYTPATVTYNFSGTTSTTTNTVFTLQGLTLSSTTASSTSLGTYLAAVSNGFNFSGANSGFTSSFATISATQGSILFTAPTTTGTIINNVAVTARIVIGAGGSSFTCSVSGLTFSGGVNTNTPIISYGNLGYTDNIVFNTTGTNV